MHLHRSLNVMQEDCYYWNVSSKKLTKEVFIKKDFIQSILTCRLHRCNNFFFVERSRLGDSSALRKYHI